MMEIGFFEGLCSLKILRLKKLLLFLGLDEIVINGSLGEFFIHLIEMLPFSYSSEEGRKNENIFKFKVIYIHKRIPLLFLSKVLLTYIHLYILPDPFYFIIYYFLLFF